ncbi:tyrosine-protein phosphatase [Ornithinimicrobium murale]|uniref:tyrosine-protein phosphatase n=1 Tax=Ornithinimicrobium murale TaxID=1050153 RepID=UPI000E0D0806|nr:tyrosine-protein phosphatase [Ornithinimicrobium murale]
MIAHPIPSAPLPIEGTYNFREVGGYPVTGGGMTRAGALYRSDALAGLTEAGRKALAALGLRRILDLRSSPERAVNASAVDGLGMDVQHHPILKAAAPQTETHRSHSLETLYRLMIERRGKHLTAALRAMAGAEGPVLVHCTAGKDRTGVLVALALEAVGVERDAVVEDYAATEHNLAGEWSTRMLAGVSDWTIGEEDIRAIVTTSPAPVMAGLLGHLDEQYGGARTYFLAHGMRQDELETLRVALTTIGTRESSALRRCAGVAASRS